MSAGVRARTVVVTGGAKGIGLATCRRFVQLGDRVIALGRDGAALAAAAEEVEGLTTARLDVTDETAVTQALVELEPIDVLVNNAGMAESAPLERTELDSWRRHLDVNATGVFLCSRAVVAPMRTRGYGRIVIVASTAGLSGSRYTAAYTASKHAAVGLMRCIAAEVAGSGVTANAVCPTYVRTAMTERSIDRIKQVTGRSAEEAESDLVRATSLGRFLDPEEVAAAVGYLASEEAAAVNGQCLVMNGGGAR